MSTIARFSLAEYDRIVESGAFDRRHLELTRGEIRQMAPIGPMHEDAVDVLTHWSIRSVSEEQARVRVHHSIGLAELESAPEPDLAWVSPQSYAQGRPQAADVFLIIEVADSSLLYDRGDKGALYAEAGIADYWIVNLRERVVEVYRDPRADRYRSASVHRNQEEVRPLAFPEALLRPSMLWS